MRGHVLRFVITALALCIAVWLVPGLSYTGTPAGFALLAVVFGLVNMVLRPLLMILTCPLVVLTLGLFVLVINAVLLLATGALSRHLGLGFLVSGFGSALLGGIIVSIASTLLAITIRERPAR